MNALPADFTGAEPVTARQRIELEIERLIALLDAFDGDADIEANGDEADQSYPEGWMPAGQFYLEDDEDAGDTELGSTPVTLNADRRSPTRYVRRRARA